MMNKIKNILKWQWANNPMYISFAVYCILQSEDKGSFTTTMSTISQHTGISYQQLRTIKKNCVEMGFINTAVNSGVSITIYVNQDYNFGAEGKSDKSFVTNSEDKE